ncbi:2-dehydropantoate 2-reductase [Candidatus Marinamargulisbacteria bacterium SCGC AG-343-D04]|nr:2-dehydropantoate 2-reductase [Candidatus Marinamargulisbacteria bacterium SCGC AG-343-D04]
MSSKILIIGMGAIGSLYASFCNQNDVIVECVSRSHFQSIEENGIDIIQPNQSIKTWKPSAVYSRIGELTYSPDYIVIATKVLPSINLISELSKIVGKDTSIVLLQNGIDIEHPYIKAFPNTHLISGLAFVCVTRVDEKTVHHQDYGRAIFGDYPSGLSEKTKEFVSFFSKAPVEIKASEHIHYQRYKKLIWNAAFNPLSVILKGKNTKEILEMPGQEDYIRAVMKEVQGLAKKEGVQIEDKVIEKNIADTKVMKPYKTSMCMDWENNREMESDAILGNALKVAQRYGLSCPKMEEMYRLLKEKG